MRVGFFDTLWQALGHTEDEPLKSATVNSLHLPTWPDSETEAAIDWNAILEESGSSQFALHLFLMGIEKGETILQR